MNQVNIVVWPNMNPPDPMLVLTIANVLTALFVFHYVTKTMALMTLWTSETSG